jgi:cell division protein ZipA
MMEYLRWILLAGGIVFVILIYVLGKRHSSKNAIEEDIDSGDLPSFSARDWDELDEGVGEVRIIARADEDDYDDDDGLSQDEEIAVRREQTQLKPRSTHEHAAEARTEETRASAVQAGDAVQEHNSGNAVEPQVILLSILAQPNSKLSGDRINTAVRANGMVFGEMNIFHRLDERGKPVYSLANMLEPGTFDPVSIQKMVTPGIIIFMQLPGPSDPLACFNHMLQSASRIADMLDAQLCNNRRQPLSENDTEALRKQVAAFDG